MKASFGGESRIKCDFDFGDILSVKAGKGREQRNQEGLLSLTLVVAVKDRQAGRQIDKVKLCATVFNKVSSRLMFWLLLFF